jgi:fructosamine-3-kinase
VGARNHVVGLDIHTGFIVNTGDDVYFIHSAYVAPYTVIREKATESKLLASSNYRVLGKITADDQLIEKWLLKTEIVTRTT